MVEQIMVINHRWVICCQKSTVIVSYKKLEMLLRFDSPCERNSKGNAMQTVLIKLMQSQLLRKVVTKKISTGSSISSGNKHGVLFR